MLYIDIIGVKSKSYECIGLELVATTKKHKSHFGKQGSIRILGKSKMKKKHIGEDL
jgi:hypothetical protein